MPYIKQEDRKKYDYAIAQIATELNGEGELNYIISKICHFFLAKQGITKYNDYNTVIGVLECAKLELQRQLVAPYEDKKIAENGHISDLDE